MRVAKGSLVVAMWPSQIVYRLCVCSFVARAINSDHTRGGEGGAIGSWEQLHLSRARR